MFSFSPLHGFLAEISEDGSTLRWAAQRWARARSGNWEYSDKKGGGHLRLRVGLGRCAGVVIVPARRMVAALCGGGGVRASALLRHVVQQGTPRTRSNVAPLPHALAAGRRGGLARGRAAVEACGKTRASKSVLTARRIRCAHKAKLTRCSGEVNTMPGRSEHLGRARASTGKQGRIGRGRTEGCWRACYVTPRGRRGQRHLRDCLPARRTRRGWRAAGSSRLGVQRHSEV